MAVGNEDVAVGRCHHGRGRVELVVAGTRNSRLAKRQQDLALRAELEHLVALALHPEAVGEPDIAVAIDMNAMREDQHAGTEGLHQLAGCIEFQDRIKRRSLTGKGLAFSEQSRYLYR